MRVILLDDHQTFRESFSLALRHEGSVEVVGETGVGPELYSLVEAQRPDLVVADLILKDGDGISICRELTRRDLGVKILILTMHSSALFVRDAFDAGAHGYAVKEQPLAEILEAMRSVLRGNRYVSPLLAPMNLSSPERGRLGVGPQGLDRLSSREREIFSLIVRGLSSKDIGQTLSISIKTVETHRTHINRKLGIRSPADLMRLAALKGLITAPPAVTPPPAIPAADKPGETTPREHGE